MRTIAHLSDLHFGCHDERVVEGLIADIAANAPNLVVISGDLTQRGRIHQFKAARAFLDRLPKPVLVVPGNHDIPLYDLIQRFFGRLARYQRYITADLLPFIADEEIAVLGINTARSAAISNGRISHPQAQTIVEAFSGVPPTCTRILVAHHPLMRPTNAPHLPIVGRSVMARQALAKGDVHLFLGGHYHRAFTGQLAVDHLEVQRSILIIHAGTAISRRLRSESNSYNLLGIEKDRVSCTIKLWGGNRFEPVETDSFEFAESQWIRR